jgi:hypothetical protein
MEQTFFGRKAGKLSSDFYPTPKWCTRILLRNYKFDGDLWECACGDGRMSTVLEEEYPVVSTDLHEMGYGISGINFLLEKEARAKNLVTNPPFNIINKFLWHMMELEFLSMAIFARNSLLESRKRYSYFKEYPPKKIIHITDRVNFQDEKPGGQWTMIWCIWEKRYKGITESVWDSFYAPNASQLTIQDLLGE